MTYFVQFLNGKHWMTIEDRADGGLWAGTRDEAIILATEMRVGRYQKFRIRPAKP